MESHEEHRANAQAENVKKRKTTKESKPSTGPKPFIAVINQIGRTDKTADLQATVQELKERLVQPRTTSQSLHSRIPLQFNTPPARIIQALPELAREIEDSTIDERLSRFSNRMALANFHGGYHAAQARPEDFLQALDRDLHRYTSKLRARNGTKRAEVKERFTELVFCRSRGKRDWKKDSVCVNNWQSWGKPWFELMNRFGRGILLLVLGEMTVRRQV